MARSLAEQFSALPEAEQAARLARLTDAEAEAMLTDWSFWARPDQLTPAGDWRVWLAMAGRGWGKTRVGAEWVREIVDAGRNRIALVGPTAADVRDVMIQGESGLLSVFPKHQRPVYEPSKRLVTFHTGAIATCYSAEEPERLRGPQHEAGWADEIAAWRYLKETWDQLKFGMRLGDDPRICATTTPKPKAMLKKLLAHARTHVTHGSTYDNAANLADSFIEDILDEYEGTTLGRQELHAEILEENPNALWERALINDTRLACLPEGVTLDRIVVAVDPAVTATGDETGIIVAGRGSDGDGYVLDDRSVRAKISVWASRAVTAYDDHEADRVVGEVNNGGDLVEEAIRHHDENVSYKAVRASRGKQTRAEPIAGLYQQKRIHHIGTFDELEDQMCNWTPEDDESPDRMDALVWALAELFPKKPRTPGIRSLD